MNRFRLYLALAMAAVAGLHAQTGAFGLEELMALARENNGGLGQKREKLAQARAGENRAQAEKGPSLTGLMSYSYLGLPPEGVTLEAGELGSLPLGGGAYLPLPSERVTVLEDTGHNYYRLGLSLTQPLYTWGKLELARRAASEGVLMEKEALDGEERKIRTELKTLLATLDVLDGMDENLKGQEEILPRLIEIVRESYRKGFLLKTDLLEAELLEREVEVARRELTVNRDNALRRIGRLTGQERPERENLAYRGMGKWSGELSPQLDEGSLAAELMKMNGELRQLGAALQAERYGEELLKKEKSALPDLGFQLDLSYADDALPLSSEEWTAGGLTATATVVLSGTIYDGGRSRYDWEKARSSARERALQYGEAAEALREELAGSLAELELMESRIAYSEIKIEKIRAEKEMKRNLWQTGTEGEEEYLKKSLEEKGALLDRDGEILRYFQTLYKIEYMRGAE